MFVTRMAQCVGRRNHAARLATFTCTLLLDVGCAGAPAPRTGDPQVTGAPAAQAASCPACLPAATGLRSPEKAGPTAALPMVLLLSIDGLMPRHVHSADALGLAITNLRRFPRHGTVAEGVLGTAPSLTYPAHTTLITGVSPLRHGITMNLTFDPMFRNQKGWFWYTSDIRVPTLWSAAHEAGLATANLFWPASVGAPVDDNVPQYWRAAMPDDRKLHAALCTPGLLDELERAVGPMPSGEDFALEAEDLRTRYAEYVLTHRRPTLTTMYLGALDEAEHRFGPTGKLALEVLERLDGMVGRLRDALVAVARDNHLMVVVSDHGFYDFHEEIHLPALLREAGLIQIDGDRQVKSWRAAAWTAGGTGAIYLNDQTDQAAQRVIERLITELGADRHCGVSRVFRASEVESLQGFAGASTVLELKAGCKFGQNLSGPTRLRKSGGTHGYLPDDPAMDAVFMIAGTGVVAGRSLGRIDMRAVAPTLAASLGVRLPDAQVDRIAL